MTDDHKKEGPAILTPAFTGLFWKTPGNIFFDYFLKNDPIFRQISFSRSERERLVGKSEFKNGRGVKKNV
jgi:hypothetical protein